MDITHMTTDQVILWQWKFISLNYTIIYTWGVMIFLTIFSALITRNLSEDINMSRWQNLLEIIVFGIENQIMEISLQNPRKYISFIGTLFIFISISNLLIIIPGYYPPTASLSTTAALALCVFVAVPVYGISEIGFIGYLKNYTRPSVFNLPFNIIGDISRTLALAVRLFGNIMSGNKVVAIMLSIAPLIFPVFIQLLGILTGLVQAYIFAVLAMVYIASATRIQRKT